MDPQTSPGGADGLHATAHGPLDGPALVLVHGFTQTGATWGPVGDDLARDHRVVRLDVPGHGRSGHRDADLPTGAGLVGDVGGVATYVGYSLGGRLCWHLALARPDLVRRLVVLGGHPGIEDPDARASRAREDDERARHLEAVGLEQFLEEWLALPLFSGLTDEAAAIGARRDNTVAGLAASLRHAGTGSQRPLWDRLATLAMPVLLVAGAEDRAYRTLNERAARTIGTNATVAVVPGAGHAAHLERPAELLAVLRPWLAATAGHA